MRTWGGHSNSTQKSPGPCGIQASDLHDVAWTVICQLKCFKCIRSCLRFEISCQIMDIMYSKPRLRASVLPVIRL